MGCRRLLPDVPSPSASPDPWISPRPLAVTPNLIPSLFPALSSRSSTLGGGDLAQPPGLEKPNATPCPCSSSPPGEDGLRASPGGAAHEHSSRPRLLLPQIPLCDPKSPPWPQIPPVTPNPPHGRFPCPAGTSFAPLAGAEPLTPHAASVLAGIALCPCPPPPPGGSALGFWSWAFWGRNTAPWCQVRASRGDISWGRGAQGAGGLRVPSWAWPWIYLFIFLVLFPSKSSAPGPRAVGAVLTRRGCDLPKQKAKSCKTGAFAPKSVFFFFFAPFLPLSVEELSRLDLLLSSPSSCPRPPPPACCCTELRRRSRGLEP